MRLATAGAAAALALAAACGTSSTPPKPSSKKAVAYVAGEIRVSEHTPNLAGYWRDGARVELPALEANGHCYAEDLEVSGKDVYATGECFVSGTIGGKPVYWKNGVVHELPRLPDTDAIDNVGLAAALQADGTLIVAGGAGEVGGIARPALWVGGELTTLSELPVNVPEDQQPRLFQGGVVRDVKVVGADVYATGFLMDDTLRPTERVGHPRATLWVNGEAFLLEPRFRDAVDGRVRDSIGESLSVDGGLTYVATSHFVVTDAAAVPPTMRSIPTPALFRVEPGPIAVPVALYQDVALAAIERVAVDAGFVYSAGYYYEGILTTPALWNFLDRVRLPMADPLMFGSAFGLARHGGSTYVSGLSYVPTEADPLQLVAQPLLWVDGVARLLELPSGQVVPASGTPTPRAAWAGWAGAAFSAEKDPILGGVPRGVRVQDE